MRALITLTSDFGPASPYIAQMKGAILSLCREVDLVDVTHGIGPQNVREGAVVLADATPQFPPGTIHVAVIDPGVGTARRLVYAEIGGQRYLAPDNGLLSLLAERSPPRNIVVVENRAYWSPTPSHTFHGRDILAPVAARLAAGLDCSLLGPATTQVVRLQWPLPRRSGGSMAGQVLYVDSFGNLITNIRRDDLGMLGDLARLVIECGRESIQGVAETYGEEGQGQMLALIDSQGRLEIAVRGGNAARVLGAAVGAVVRVTGRV